MQKPQVICHMLMSLDGKVNMEGYRLVSAEPLADGAVWMRYEKMQ